MSSGFRPTVIVGASIGGVRTAQQLRANGHEHPIILVGDELVMPYDKPPLSKAFLAGSAQRADITLLSEADAAALDVQLRLGTPATSLDLKERSVILADDQVVPFGQLVIATGARPRRPAWADAPGINYLRSVADAEAIAAHLEPGTSIAIVGAGFIGAEIAATARGRGCAVTLIDPLPVPMGRLLTDVVGAEFVDLHRANGVTVEFGVGVAAVRPASSGYALSLSDGRTLTADTAVVGVGVTPNIEWLEDSGIELDDGVVCDQHSQARLAEGGLAEGVFAVGDVARWFNPRKGRPVRVEHWTNAVDQARVVAHNLTQPQSPIAHDAVEFFWSDQYNWKSQFIGDTLSDDVVVQSSGDRFAALYAEDGILVGSVVVNWPRMSVSARTAIQRGDTRVSVLAKVMKVTLA